MPIWNPWHGCRKISDGCVNCYMYRRDSEFNKDSTKVSKTKDFNLPVQKNKSGSYKMKPTVEPVYTCMTSDFFIEEADNWRSEVWNIIKERKELEFIIITKRIKRFGECLPKDWGEGYENVTIACTCENQKEADSRLPMFLKFPVKHRQIVCEPLLENLDLQKYLDTGKIERLICGGESGPEARICDFDWIISLRKQCIKSKTGFWFKQTGTRFKKNGKIYKIERKQQFIQAVKSNLSFTSENELRILSEKTERIKKLLEEPEQISFENLLSEENKEIQVKNKKFKETDLDANTALDELFEKLSKSKFRSSFHLKQKDIDYILDKGIDTIKIHAYDIIKTRLAPLNPPNDGKQTPTKGHPVFLSQHATGCCCRNCLYKWHHISKNRELSRKEIDYVVNVLISWIIKQI